MKQPAVRSQGPGGGDKWEAWGPLRLGIASTQQGFQGFGVSVIGSLGDHLPLRLWPWSKDSSVIAKEEFEHTTSFPKEGDEPDG